MKFLKRILPLLFSFTVLTSCHQTEKKGTEETQTKDIDTIDENVTVTISQDVVKLSKLLDLTTYKPTRVKFKHTFIDNSGLNERITVPGPSDSYLEAILYFDSLTMKKFHDFDKHANYDSPDFKKKEFAFSWLPKQIKKE